MENVSFDVQDMHCGGCVRHVTEALRRLDGVEVRQVAVGAADVSFDPAKTTARAIALALADAGYPAALAGARACHVERGQAGGCCPGTAGRL
jgi:copper chaperone CopZ